MRDLPNAQADQSSKHEQRRKNSSRRAGAVARKRQCKSDEKPNRNGDGRDIPRKNSFGKRVTATHGKRIKPRGQPGGSAAAPRHADGIVVTGPDYALRETVK